MRASSTSPNPLYLTNNLAPKNLQLKTHSTTSPILNYSIAMPTFRINKEEHLHLAPLQHRSQLRHTQGRRQEVLPVVLGLTTPPPCSTPKTIANPTMRAIMLSYSKGSRPLQRLHCLLISLPPRTGVLCSHSILLRIERPAIRCSPNKDHRRAKSTKSTAIRPRIRTANQGRGNLP